MMLYTKHPEVDPGLFIRPFRYTLIYCISILCIFHFKSFLRNIAQIVIVSINILALISISIQRFCKRYKKSHSSRISNFHF